MKRKLITILCLILVAAFPLQSLVYAAPARKVVPADGTGIGLKAEYYDNLDFTNLKLTKTDGTVDFNWGTGSPDLRIGADTFSVKWTGLVQPKYSEKYSFYTVSDDGVQLWVNNQLIIDNWNNHSAKENKGKYEFSLIAGQKYDIQMKYYENTGYTAAKLYWSCPSQKKEIIPQTQLYPAENNGIPSNFTTTATENSISLSWDTFADAIGYDVYVDETVIVDNGSNTTYSNDQFAPNSIHTFRVRTRKATGNSEWSETITKATMPASGNGTGLKADYYGDKNLTKFIKTKTDSTVNFDWGTGVPDTSIAANNFSIRWSGYVLPKFTETYNFYTSSDDGTRLWVDGKLLIDDWKDHSAKEDKATITLNAGQKYDIKMEYYENSGYASAKLSWSSASQKKEIIPQSQLFPLFIPAVPQNITTVVTGTSISLAWDAVEGATGYQIDVGGRIKEIGTELNYEDKELLQGTKHEYKVRAIADNALGTWSEPLIKYTTLGIPCNFVVASTTNTIKLSWDEVVGATGYDVILDNGEAIDNGENTSYTAKDLVSATEYSFKVRAKTMELTGEWSEVQKKITVLEVPANVKATAGSSTIIVSWDTIQGAAGYEVIAGEKTYDAGENTSIEVNSIIPGIKYTYKVRAKTVLVNSEWSEGATSWIPLKTPTLMSDAVSNTEISLKWDTVIGASRYNVFEGDNLIYSGENTSYVAGNLTPGTLHIYKVRAETADISSEYSAELPVMTTETVSLPPVVLSVIAVDNNTVNVIFNSKVDISTAVFTITQKYGAEQNLEVTSVLLGDNNTTVVLSTASQDAATLYELTATGIKSEDGISLDEAKLLFVGIGPVIIPTGGITSVIALISSDDITRLVLTFDQEVDVGSATDVNNYMIDNGIGKPLLATCDENNKMVVVLSIPSTDSGRIYRITVNKMLNSQGIDIAEPITGVFVGKAAVVQLGVPGNLVAKAASTAVTLTWDGVAGATGYDVEVDNIIITTASNNYYIEALVPLSSHTFRVRAFNKNGPSDWCELYTLTTLDSKLFNVKINFQPSGAEVPEGYIADIGDTYRERNGFVYGWNKPHVNFVRDRNKNSDQKLDTNCLMLNGGIWEIAVPNGTYNVTVSVGDAGFASIPTINVEGINYWNSVSLAANQFIQLTNTINVSDGKLTINQGGVPDLKTVINYIEISEIIPEPKNITYIEDDNSIYVKWDQVLGATGYVIEVDGVIINNGLKTDFTHLGLVNNSQHNYRVRTYNARGSGNWSELLTATTLLGSEFKAKINFQAQDVEIPFGYLPDYGELYGVRNGLTYGWNKVHTNFVRDRNNNSDQRLDTLCLMLNGGVWEIMVPNGTYSVTLSVGDASFATTPTINVEGVNYWTNVSLAANQFLVATKTVLVNDGKLTINQGGVPDLKTAINFIFLVQKIQFANTPTNLCAKESNDSIELSWDNQTDILGFDVEVDGNIIDNGMNTTYKHTGLILNSQHTYRVRAKNVRGFGEWTTYLNSQTLTGKEFIAKINFQEMGVEIPEGYTVDAGEVYGTRNGYSYGWNKSHTNLVRDRNKNSDQKLDTICLMLNSAVWEMEVPNGTYEVTVSCGDAGFASTPTLNVEGINYWDALNLKANQFAALTKTIVVSDGKLTLNQGGAADLKTAINYIEIVQKFTLAPIPSNLYGKASTTFATISWDTTVGAITYDIEVDGVVFNNDVKTTFIHNEIAPNTQHVYRVRSVNYRGLSDWSAPIFITTLKGTEASIKINFQAAGVDIPEGYLPDVGEVYGERNGYKYGWNKSHANFVRDRNKQEDQKLDTICLMLNGAVWDIELENGTYDVTVSVGDSGYATTPTINVEGYNYWTGISLPANNFLQKTMTITITDGKLSVNQGNVADLKTAINYIEIIKRD